MNMENWIQKNTDSLNGKTVVITGATGGLGSAACRYILACGGRIIMVNRNREKSRLLRGDLLEEFPGASIDYLLADFRDIQQVRAVCQQLKQREVDILMLNAGAYAIAREVCSTGYDNVFEINFIAHYYMVRQLLPQLEKQHGKIVATGSIAHRFVTADFNDVDLRKAKDPNKIYGNSKRFLMFSLTELMKQHPEVCFAIGHPGISPTGITDSYPKALKALIRYPMKITFMSPAKAVRSIVKAIFEQVPYLSWIGPRHFDIWGSPRTSVLDSCSAQERTAIFEKAQQIYDAIENS